MTALLLDEDYFTRRCGLCYRAVNTSHFAAYHNLYADGSLRCYEEHVVGARGFAIPVAPQHDRRLMKDVIPPVPKMTVSMDYIAQVMNSVWNLPPEEYERPNNVQWLNRWALLDGTVWLQVKAVYDDHTTDTFWAAVAGDQLLTEDSL